MLEGQFSGDKTLPNKYQSLANLQAENQATQMRSKFIIEKQEKVFRI